MVELSKEIQEAIDLTAIRAAEETINILKNKNMLNNRDYYKRVEKILYNYNQLEESIKEIEEEKEEIELSGLRERSKSITYYSSSSGMRAIEDRYLLKLEQCEYRKKEIELYKKKIDRALAKINKNKYYGIIEKKYIKKYNDDEKRITDDGLAEEYGVERITIIRNRKRLINKLITLLFPESIMD